MNNRENLNFHHLEWVAVEAKNPDRFHQFVVNVLKIVLNVNIEDHGVAIDENDQQAVIVIEYDENLGELNYVVYCLRKTKFLISNKL